MADIMTFRERCSCGAEFEVTAADEFSAYLQEDLEQWRERHEKVCPHRRADETEESVQTIDNSADVVRRRDYQNR